MGRPIKKKYMGTPTAAGTQIKIQFHNGTASVNGWIVKQKGSKRFVCTDGTVKKLCSLSTKASADLLAGEMSITVKNDAGNLFQVKKISAHWVTLEDGTRMRWVWSNSTTDTYVEMEEAGDNAALLNADNFEAD